MKKTHEHVQFAALPFRFEKDGRPQLLLMTSRETRRWVIPRGWPVRGLKPRQVAAREAFEEAGLLGQIIGKRPVGSYHYSKQIDAVEDILCSVDVFLFRVDGQADAWPEKGQRELRWVEPADAAEMILEGGLAEIFRRAVPGCLLPTTKR